MSATCKSALLSWAAALGVFLTCCSVQAEKALRDKEQNEEEVVACKDSETGKVSYRAAEDSEKDGSCRKLSPTSGTFNQVRDFDGYRASLDASSEESASKNRVRKKGDLEESNADSKGGAHGRAALTSFDYDELQSKRNPRKFQCHVEGETKVNKGCRVEIELIRGALTTVSFSRLGRSSSNTVKWKRVLEGECRDLTVRAVVSECE